MHGSRTLPLLALTSALLMPSLADAQESRIPLVAVVVDAAGAPAPDATLRVLGREHVTPALGGQHLDMSLETDARGRVRTKLPARFGFAIWAERRTPEGGVQLSQLVTEQRGRGALRFRLDPTAREAQRIRILGLAAWKSRAPFTLHARLEGAYDFEFELARGEQGDFALRPLPGQRLMLELRDHRGWALHRFDYVHRWHSKELVEFPLPTPLEVDVRTLDKQTGKPLPRCRIEFGAGLAPVGRSRMLAAPFRPVSLLPAGVTDDDGRLRVSLPWTSERARSGTLTAEHPGYRRTALRFAKIGKGDFEVKKDAASGRTTIEVRLSKSTTIRGRLVDASGEALADIPLLHRHSATYYAGPNTGTSTHEVEPRILRTDEKGRFEITGWAPGRSRGLFAVFDAASIQRIRRSLPEALENSLEEYPLARLLPVWSGTIPDTPKEIDVGDWSPKQLRWLPLQIQRANGRGARESRVLYATARGSAVLAHADARGRICLPVGPGELDLLAWEFGQGYSHVSLERSEAALAARTLELEPLPSVQCRFVDQSGKPAAHALVHQGGTMTNSDVPGVIPIFTAQLFPGQPDAEGVLELPFIPWKGFSYQVVAVLQTPNKFVRSHQTLTLPAGGQREKPFVFEFPHLVKAK